MGLNIAMQFLLPIIITWILTFSQTPVIPPETLDVPAPYEDAALEQIIASELDGQPGEFGVAVRKLSTGQTAYYNVDHSFTTASLYKLAVMYEAFRRRQEGSLSFDQQLSDGRTISDGLNDMITWSDNAAGEELGGRWLGWRSIEQTMSGLGLPNFVMLPGPSARPTDILELLQLIATGHAVDQGSSQEMLNLLLAQQINDRLPVYLPDGTPVAHKTGNLDGIVNDAGVVYAPNGPYIIVVMSRNTYYYGAATDAIARLSRVVYDYFEAPGLADLPPRQFSETGYQVKGRFLAYFYRHGGVRQLGLPVGDEYTDPATGLAVQYFERQRLEYHPENANTSYEVLLGRLGAEDAQRRNLLNTDPFRPLPPGTQSTNDCTYFPQTGHQICYAFRSYWRSFGPQMDGGDDTSFLEAKLLFGYPISEEFTDPATGLVVQYFERARFEYHPEYAGTPDEVLLTRLGADLLSTTWFSFAWSNWALMGRYLQLEPATLPWP